MYNELLSSEIDRLCVLGLFFATSFSLMILQRFASRRSYRYLRLLHWTHSCKKHKECLEYLVINIFLTHFVVCCLFASPFMLYTWACLFAGLLLCWDKVLHWATRYVRRHRTPLTVASLALMLPGLYYPVLLVPILMVDALESLSCFVMSEDEYQEINTKYPLISNDSKPDGKCKRRSGLWQHILYKAHFMHREKPDKTEENAC